LSGCATSFTHRVNPPAILESRETLYLKDVPAVDQRAYQCGPAALESVIRYWGGNADADSIGEGIYKPGSRGVLNFSLAQYAKTEGFWSEIHEERAGDGLKNWLRRGVPPIVMLDSGVLWARAYHFVVLKGFDDHQGIFYANTGVPETQAIEYKEFERRWKKAGYWSLIISPPEKVDWDLSEAQSVELALIFEKNGDLIQAERWLESALKMNPESVPAKFNLANIYLKSKRFGQATLIYQGLLKSNPGRSEISNNLAWVYYEEGLYQDALAVVMEAFKNGAQRNYDILDTMGMIYCKLGRANDAALAFAEAMGRIAPEDAQALGAVRNHADACERGSTHPDEKLGVFPDTGRPAPDL